MIDVQCTINTTAGVEYCTLLVRGSTSNIKDLRLSGWVPRGVSWDQELDKLIKGVMAITGVDDPSQIFINGQPADLFSVV